MSSFLDIDGLTAKINNLNNDPIHNQIKNDPSILYNKEYIYDELNLSENEVVGLIAGSKLSDEGKKDLIDIYELSEYNAVSIIKTYSDSNKEKELLENPKYNISNKIDILSSFETKNLINFINNYKESFLSDIKIYRIIGQLNSEKQLEFVSNLDTVNLTESEKKEILVVMNKDVKEKIDVSKLTPTLRAAISFETNEFKNRIILDLERDLEDYRGLDSLIRVNPTKYTDEQRSRFIKLCKICPDLTVISLIDSSLDENDTSNFQFTSTAAEYIQAEEWIQNLLNSLKSEYTKAQKIAIIDNAIGTLIDYSPVYETEVFNATDCKSLYRVIANRCGVCNGISGVAEYIFKRAGIDCEIVHGIEHTFLKLIGIEFTLDNGETVVGNTILDPTWNLTAHRFSGKPPLFCISYEEARRFDIDSEGKDWECHKNDEKLKDATFSLDEKSLRNLYKSVGLADNNGEFQIKKLTDRSEQLHKEYASQPLKDLEEQFLLLSNYCPEFATHHNSTMSILSNNLLNNELFEYNRCVVNRVYKKSDTNKKPVIFVYIKSDKIGERFYYADENERQFIESPHNMFLEQFECYEEDIKRNDGKRWWESDEQERNVKETSEMKNLSMGDKEIDI